MQYEFVAQGSNDVWRTVNPARPSEEVGRYGVVPPGGLAALVERARAAQAEWARVPDVERGLVVGRFLDAVTEHADRIAGAVTAEQGKILAEAKAETLKGVAEGRFMCGEAARVGGSAAGSARPQVRNLILRRPRGVVVAICPWNFPAMTPLRKLCPALVFGNAMIMKPSQFTPAAAFLLAEIARPLFPNDLFQIAVCGGAQAGELIAMDGVDAVSFTGSVETGRKVYAAAASNLIPVQLELGGKNAAVVNDSDDLDGCLDAITGAALMTAGQRCTAISRVLVRDELADAVVEGLAERTQAVRLGDGMHPQTTMGPLCNEPHLRSVEAMTARAIEEGATAVAGGAAAVAEDCEGGYFYQPTVLDGVAPQSTGGCEEIFGPVISVIRYRDFDEAMEILNGTPFGLTSCLFSDSNRLVQRFLNESRNGMLHVNHGSVPDINMPFGGIKHSGVGPYSVGASASQVYTTEHAAYIGWN